MNPFTILINGRNNAGDAFASAEKQMLGMNRRFNQLKQAFVGGGMIMAMRRIADAILDTSTRTDEMAEASDRAKSAWRDFFSVIGDGFASAIIAVSKWSAGVAANMSEIRDSLRRGIGEITLRISGVDPQEAAAEAARLVDESNAEAAARRWKSDKGVQDLEKKRADLTEKDMTATQRLEDAKAKLAEEEAKLAALGQYDLDRVPVLNRILELQSKIAAAMKDQAAEAAKIRLEEQGRIQEIVGLAQDDVNQNRAALNDARAEVRKSPAERAADRRAQRDAAREERKAANRERIAMEAAARDPQRRYLSQLEAQRQRMGIGIGDAGALLNQGEDANVPRTVARGISDRYRRLLGASDALADSEKTLVQVEKTAAKQLADLNAAHPELVPLGEIKHQLVTLNTNLVGGSAS